MLKEEEKALKKFENIVADLGDAERGAIIYLKQGEIKALRVCLRLIRNLLGTLDHYNIELNELKGKLKNSKLTSKELLKYFEENF